MTYLTWYCCPESFGSLEQGKQPAWQIQWWAAIKGWTRLLAVMLNTKAEALQSPLKLCGKHHPPAGWDWRFWTEGNHCSCKRSGDMDWLEKEGLTCCDMLETPLCSELYRHGVQPMQRTKITRKGDGELVSCHWYCFCFDSLKFSVEEPAFLCQPQKPFSFFLDPHREIHSYHFSIVLDFYYQPFSTQF